MSGSFCQVLFLTTAQRTSTPTHDSVTCTIMTLQQSTMHQSASCLADRIGDSTTQIS